MTLSKNESDAVAPLLKQIQRDFKWTTCHLRNAKTVWFPKGDGEQEQLNNVESELVCYVEYMGDRSDVWIIETRDGLERSRHNAKFVESIIWI